MTKNRESREHYVWPDNKKNQKNTVARLIIKNNLAKIPKKRKYIKILVDLFGKSQKFISARKRQKTSKIPQLEGKYIKF